jgi:hypothetical protein
MAVDWDRELKMLEAACNEALAIMRRLQPGNSSRPKDFMTFHDAWLAHERARDRLSRFREERARQDPVRPARS